MEKFNGVRKIGKNLYRAMIFIEGRHVHLMDGSEDDCEDAIDKALFEKKKLN